MNPRRLLPAFGLLLLAFHPGTAGALRIQRGGVLLGIVGDTAGKPLPETEVVALRARLVVRTDRRGIFALALPPGEETFIVRRIGFLPQTFDATIGAGDSTRVGVNLAPAPHAVELPDLVVEADGVRYAGKMTGFADRMLHSGVPRGNFLTRKDIEDSGLGLSIDLVVRAGLKLRDDQRPDKRMRSNHSMVICPRGAPSMRNIPKLAWVVDGVRMSDDFDINSMDISQIEAIEVYRSAAQIPSQYNISGFDCAVLLWLRGGN